MSHRRRRRGGARNDTRAKLLLFLTKNVERRAGFEPLDLLLVERVVEEDSIFRSVGVVDHRRDLSVRGDLGQADQRNPVVDPDLVEVGGIDEPQTQHALLLEVGLGDPGEGAGDDRRPGHVPRFHRSVLPRRSLAVVLVGDGDPPDASLLVAAGQLGQ